jgi:hypothetical protein
MEQRVYKCDVCGRERQQSNHWFVVRFGDAFHVYHWDFFGEGREDDSIPHKHICGQECLQRILQPFLDLRSTIPTEPASASASAPVSPEEIPT